MSEQPEITPDPEAPRADNYGYVSPPGLANTPELSSFQKDLTRFNLPPNTKLDTTREPIEEGGRKLIPIQKVEEAPEPGSEGAAEVRRGPGRPASSSSQAGQKTRVPRDRSREIQAARERKAAKAAMALATPEPEPAPIQVLTSAPAPAQQDTRHIKSNYAELTGVHMMMTCERCGENDFLPNGVTLGYVQKRMNLFIEEHQTCLPK